MRVDPRQFREVAGLFATGVTIVVAEVQGQIHAMTANAVTSVSLDPLLMLFCPSRKARIAQDLPGLTHFSINILRQDQQALSTYFAGGWKDSAPPPFRFIDSPAGPRLEGALASIGCRTHSITEAGDHFLVLGEVIYLHTGSTPHQPLLFVAGKYRGVDFSEGVVAPDLADVEDEPPDISYPR
ncbi:MAG: flavin reductase family protein [Steroidobacteraceae bacterium]